MEPFGALIHSAVRALFHGLHEVCEDGLSVFGGHFRGHHGGGLVAPAEGEALKGVVQASHRHGSDLAFCVKLLKAPSSFQSMG